MSAMPAAAASPQGADARRVLGFPLFDNPDALPQDLLAFW